ncbi:hypothetical protein IQ264_09605 [Phormidium sp. LEGE 05292]|uniref:hypothetical protein n=1 Tax=[Phormidium] sp. LEGE 05292 TaxID=767427 RepID=UPI00187EFDEC|nr:hypothetical protein [Phormidium sp. LEGE 05292]MBE9225676.1 hypothetical protein [Phormidium sp. LEGE 05292]
MKIGVFLSDLGKTAVYYPRLAKVTGSVTSCIFFCHLLQWRSRSNNPYDWLKISVQEIEQETGLNSREQELARKELIERNLLKERLVEQQSNALEFWLNLEALEEKLHELLHELKSNTLEETVIFKTIQPNAVKKTELNVPWQRPPIAVKVTPNYQFNGPWKSHEQFAEFQKLLLEYAKEKGFYNPADWVFKIIDGITKGIVSPFWDEFVQGIPLGESQKVKRDWEIEIGIAYPAFEEERIQYYVQKGEPLEVAVSKARSDLRNPVLGKDLWEGFLRKCDRIADEAIKAKKSGIKTPYLPPSFTDRPAITKESVMQKLTAVSPQFSLESSSYQSLAQINHNEQKVTQKKPDSASDVPNIDTLKAVYKTPMGKKLVEKQITEHPEWGYAIVDGELVDLIPF